LKSGLFCAQDLHWTAKREEAHDFGSTFKAATFSAEHLLREVEVVLTFDGAEQEVRINLEQESGCLKFNGSRHEGITGREERLPSGSGDLPPGGEPVWVQCEGYRTMAYRDAKGLWWNVGNGQEVKGILTVVWPERREGQGVEG
jgi:hypothetical protein